MEYSNNKFTKNQNEYKLFGSYFLEAGLISFNQINEALTLQKNEYPYKKIGEILVIQGWLKSGTIDYFIDKIIAPERDRQSGKNQINYYVNSKNINTQCKEKTQNIIKINLSPEKICKILLIISIGLIFANILAHVCLFLSDGSYSGRLFRLDEESNIPTFYSAFNLAISSVLLALIAWKKKLNNSRYTKHWQFLSVLFFLLAIDEVAMIHEILTILRKPLNASGFFYFTWVVPAIIFLIFLSLMFISVLKSLPKRIRTLFIVAGIIYIGGAIGVEMIGAYHSETFGENNITYGIITTIEESLEIIGVLVFIYSLLSYLQNYSRQINLYVSFKK